MTTAQVLLIIIFCLKWPTLCLTDIINETFFFPNFNISNFDISNIEGGDGVTLMMNASAWLNPLGACISLTAPVHAIISPSMPPAIFNIKARCTYNSPPSTSTDNPCLLKKDLYYGGILRLPNLNFYEVVLPPPPCILITVNLSTGGTAILCSPAPEPPAAHPFEPFAPFRDDKSETAAAPDGTPPSETQPPSGPPPPPIRYIATGMSFNINFEIVLHSRTGVASQGGGMVFLLTNDTSRYLNISDPLAHFGVFPSLGGRTEANIWAVEFDTKKDLVVDDIDYNHIGINVNSARSVRAKSLTPTGLKLYGNYPINVWLEYNYPSKIMFLYVGNQGRYAKPAHPFLTMADLDMTTVIGPDMYAGFAARGFDQLHQVNYWSVGLSSMIPEIPQPPNLPTSVDGPVISPPPPPAPPPTILLPIIGVQVEAATLSLFTAWCFVGFVIYMVMRCTRCGQRILWKAYNGVKFLHPFCNKSCCVYWFTVPHDAKGQFRKNAGRPTKSLRRKVLNPGAGSGHKAGPGKGPKPGAVKGPKPAAGKGQKPTVGKGQKPAAGKGQKPAAGRGQKPGAAKGQKPGPAKRQKPGPGTRKPKAQQSKGRPSPKKPEAKKGK